MRYVWIIIAVIIKAACGLTLTFTYLADVIKIKAVSRVALTFTVFCLHCLLCLYRLQILLRNQNLKHLSRFSKWRLLILYVEQESRCVEPSVQLVCPSCGNVSRIQISRYMAPLSRACSFYNSMHAITFKHRQPNIMISNGSHFVGPEANIIERCRQFSNKYSVQLHT